MTLKKSNEHLCISPGLHIPIYEDSLIEDEERFYVGFKSKESIEPGYRYVNTKMFNEQLSKVKGSPIDKEEVDKLLKEQSKNRTLSDINFIVTNNITEEKIDKIIKILINKYKIK